MVSKHPNLRLLGYTIDDIRSPDWRTPTEAVFVNPDNPQELFRHYDASGRSSQSTPDEFATRDRARQLSDIMNGDIKSAIDQAASMLKRTREVEEARNLLERQLERIYDEWVL